MTVAVGDRIPDIELKTFGAEGPESVRTGDVLGHGKVVLFAVPGAFTPTCSDYHLPSYLFRYDDLRGQGRRHHRLRLGERPLRHGCVGDAQGVGDRVVLLADGNGEFTRAMGLEFDGSTFGLGTRSQRYAAVIEDGVITTLAVEPGGGLSVSAADEILATL